MLILLLSGAVLLGCKHSRPSDATDTAKEKRPAKKSASRPATAREPAPQNPLATPLNEPSGKVASVNAGLRFIVIDFAYNPLPQVDQRLSVFRNGQKVGEVKISNQMRNNIVAADIVEGEAQVGDEVRPN